MALVTKQELLETVNSADMSDKIKIKLMEDITDSFDEEAINKQRADYEADKAEMEAQIACIKADLEAAKQRYKDRFLEGGTTPPDRVDVIENEEKIVDVKEI